jgi:UDP-N-acetylmuramoyl-tripeptide--D-alanyl-D-alanine ligase
MAGMISRLKKILYFPVASYFRFFAHIYLQKWNPKVVVITGSQGKTTLLHMLEAQFGDKAIYSHRANSSFGIPFHILGLERKSFHPLEWVTFFFKAPFQALREPYKEKIYIVEADCDRTHEGKFLAELLRPSITLWTSSSRTHSMNFILKSGETIEDATAREFSEFARSTKDLLVANGDIFEIVTQTENLPVKKIYVRENDYLTSFVVKERSTEFVIGKTKYDIPFLVPKDVSRSIVMTEIVCRECGIDIDSSFKKLALPPSRSGVFEGLSNRILIDSTYNTSLESIRAMMELFELYQRTPKWAVFGDMLQLGQFEKDEHKKLGEMILKSSLDRVILVGPRLRTSTLPVLMGNPKFKDRTVSFLGPDEALGYIEKEGKGGEAMLFKGSRFLEGVVEKLLSNPKDASLLARREAIWQMRRKQWKI